MSPLAFGRFTLDRVQCTLQLGDTPVPLAASAVALLARLVDAAGRTLPATELLPLLAADGPGLWQSIEAVNAALDRAGEPPCYVAHYPDHGYAFVPPAPVRTPGTRLRAPVRSTPVHGCQQTLVRVATMLTEHRLVTLVGTGGIGKTTVALALAAEVDARYADGVCFVDLSPLADASLVAHAVASALGLALTDTDVRTGLRAFLCDKQLLLVLDSCEHVVAAAAEIAEALVADHEGVHVLATSREALSAAGEWLHRLAPMRLPDSAAGLTATEALTFPALQLFAERARASDPTFTLTDEHVAAVTAVCSRLDGIPLAIEWAAARVALLGVAGVAGQLDERLEGIADGRRSTPARHRTLAALLDWSHDLLSPTEQRALCQLAIFRGVFRLGTAVALLVDGGLGEDEATGAVLDLVAKSLVSSAPTGLRLLGTTRAYACDKLGDGDARFSVAQRHARRMLALLHDAEAEWDHMTRAEWRRAHGPCIDDVRSAIDWAAGHGETLLSIQLTLAAFSVADQTGLMSDLGERVLHARTAVTTLVPPEPLLSAQLDALPTMLQHRQQSASGSPRSTLLRALDATGRLGTVRQHLAPLTALWGGAFLAGEYGAAAAWSQQMRELARQHDDPIADLIGRRMLAQAVHFGGDQPQARSVAAGVRDDAWRRLPLAYWPSPVDPAVSMRIVLARVLWLEGHPEQAAVAAREVERLAEQDGPLSLCQARALAVVPIALWSGELASARTALALLRADTCTYSFTYWLAWCDLFATALAVPSGPSRSAAPLDGLAAKKLRDLACTFNMTTAADDAVPLGGVSDGLMSWSAPEWLRTHAARRPAAEAEAWLRQALMVARQQGALAWTLRAATDLAVLLQRRGRLAEAFSVLAPVHGAFTEGFDTADLRRAVAVLDTLR